MCASCATILSSVGCSHTPKSQSETARGEAFTANEYVAIASKMRLQHQDKRGRHPPRLNLKHCKPGIEKIWSTWWGCSQAADTTYFIPAMLPMAGVMEVTANSRRTLTLQSASPSGGTKTDTAAWPLFPGPTVHSRAVSFALLTMQRLLPTRTCRSKYLRFSSKLVAFQLHSVSPALVSMPLARLLEF